MRRKLAKPTHDRCAIHVTAGRTHPDIARSGPYSVCLTPSQRDKLFGKLPVVSPPKERRKRPGRGEPIGCGTFACVWPSKLGGRVVKITRDREDVEGLRAAKGMDRVVKVDEIFELPHAGVDLRTHKQIPIYAIVAERVQPLTRGQRKFVDEPMETASNAMLRHVQRYRGSKAKYGLTPEHKRKLVTKTCVTHRNKKACARFVDDFVDVFSQLARRGIVWQDAHPGNIGIDHAGKWKAIDLGFSGTKKRSRLPILSGR